MVNIVGKSMCRVLPSWEVRVNIETQNNYSVVDTILFIIRILYIDIGSYYNRYLLYYI